MAQKPLSEMADTGYENMSEESGYVLHEFKQFANPVFQLLEQKASKSELALVHKMLEGAATKDEIAFIHKMIEGLVSKDEYTLLINLLDNKADKKETYESLAALSGCIEQARRVNHDVTISSSEVLALNATPKILVTSPGEGKYIELIRIEVKLDFESVAYSAVDAGKDFSVGYETAGELLQVETTGLLDQSQDAMACVKNVSSKLAVNEALQISLLNGEVLSGDSPLMVRAVYYIHDSI